MQQMHFTPFKYDAEKDCLILWTLYPEKETVIVRFPLKLFKGTILYQSNYCLTEKQVLFYIYPYSFPLYWPNQRHNFKKRILPSWNGFDHIFAKEIS